MCDACGSVLVCSCICAPLRVCAETHSRIPPTFVPCVCLCLQEARLILKCRKSGVDTPAVFFVDEPGARIYMECIDGVSVKQWLLSGTASGTHPWFSCARISWRREEGHADYVPVYSYVVS